MHLLLVHTGPEFPTYLNDCIAQVRCVSNIPIHVLIDAVHEKLVVGAGVTIVQIESLPEDPYTKEYVRTTKLDASFRNGFWRAASLRFFYIHNYARQQGLQDIFHIEYDNMIYQDFTAFLPAFQTRRSWCVIDSPSRCIPSFLYWRNSDAVFDVVLSLLAAAPHGKNDMEVLAHHAQKYPKAVGLLPIVTRDYPAIHPAFSSASILFGHLFDGAAVGQYIGGVDPRNTPGDSRGFINETTAFRCDRVTLEWRRGTDGLVRPFMNGYPLVNLHIHSKDLARWASRIVQPSLAPQRIITGEAIQAICDRYCGLKEDYEFNPRFFSESHKFINLAAEPMPWDNPRLLFCYAHRLTNFRKWLPFLQNKFILVTHNSDGNITAEYADIFDSPQLIAAYVQNKCIVHPRVHSLPIGIANRLWPHGNLESFVALFSTGLPTKSRLLYFYFNIDTNSALRSQCKAELEECGLAFGTSVPPVDYLSSLASYKYAICPPGNGIDSHRIWECLYLGVTPIMIRSVFSEMLAASFPCVLLDKWSDLGAALPELDTSWKPHDSKVNLDLQKLATRIQSGSPSWLIHE